MVRVCVCVSIYIHAYNTHTPTEPTFKPYTTLQTHIPTRKPYTTFTALHHPIHLHTHPYKHTLSTLLPYYYAERSRFTSDGSSYAAIFIGEWVKYGLDLRAF